MNRVALIGENSIEYINILLDIWNNGNCAVLLDYRIPSATAVEMMVEAQVKECYIERKYFEKFQIIIGKSIRLYPYDTTLSTSQLLPTETYDKFRNNYSKDEAIVIYSSGTTGKSKGIILSHFAINTNSDAIIDYMQVGKSDCMYIVKNLTHSSTITGELLVALKTKTSLLIAPTVMPPRYIFHNIYKYKVSIIGVNPSLLSMYALEYRNKNYDISSLKKVYVSGSILSDKLYEIAHMTFINQKIYNVYGLSEAAPRVSAQRKDCCKSNSVGTPIKGVSVAIINEFGEKASVGQYGIIYVDSPSIFNGYITGELKHKSVYHGWLNTGDVGYFDKYGELHIVERIDDMIIIGAHKIYPSEIENKICSIGNIQECLIAKIKIRDEDKLCCLYSSKNDIQSDIINILGKVLMKHEIPKKFVKIVSLPRTQNGKISRQLAKKILYKELSKENCL